MALPEEVVHQFRTVATERLDRVEAAWAAVVRTSDDDAAGRPRRVARDSGLFRNGRTTHVSPTRRAEAASEPDPLGSASIVADSSWPRTRG